MPYSPQAWTDNVTPADAAHMTHIEDGIVAAVPKDLVDAKGDLLAASGDNGVARLPVGADGQVLTADAAQALGVKWAAAAVHSAQSFAYRFSTTITAPPASGQVRLDNATVASATKVWLANLTDDNFDARTVLLLIPAGATIYIQDRNDHTIYARFTTGGAAAGLAGYVELPVTYVASGGAFTNNAQIEVFVLGGGAISPTIVDAAGDLIVGTGPDVVARFAKGADGQVLKTLAGALTWTAEAAGGIPPTIVDVKGDLIAASGPDAVARLGVGADNTVLTADAAQALGVKWAAPPASGIQPTIVDAKGDLIAASAPDAVARLPVGPNDQVLVADSAQALGVKWAIPALLALIDAAGDLLVGTADNVAARLGIGTDGQVLTVDTTLGPKMKWAAAPGGAGGAMTLIQDIPLGADAATIDFTAIPATYKHLRLIADLRGTVAGVNGTDALVRFNGDTAANYDYRRVMDGVEGESGAPIASPPLVLIPGAGNLAGLFGYFDADVVDYANTARNKVAKFSGGWQQSAVFGNMRWGMVHWRSAAAINRITLLPASGNFLAGSRVSLYGIG
jgi:hypothetical protein